jgi:hypothetical protein
MLELLLFKDYPYSFLFLSAMELIVEPSENLDAMDKPLLSSQSGLLPFEVDCLAG